MTTDGGDRGDWSVVLVMLGLVVLGMAAAFGVVKPASQDLKRTLENEHRIDESLAAEKRERASLDVTEKGLKTDPRVIDRAFRDQGKVPPGEIILQPASRPSDGGQPR